MRLSLARLRPTHLALLSTAYWIGLGVVKLGAAVVAGWQVSQLPQNHGSISLGLENLLFRATIVRDGAVVWAGSASLGAIIGWVVGPPLLLVLTWRWTREMEGAEEQAGVDEIDAGNGPARRLGLPSWLTGRGAESKARQEAKARHPGAG